MKMVQIDLQDYQKHVKEGRTPIVLEVYEPEMFLGYRADDGWTLLRAFAQTDYLENGKIRKELIKDLLSILNDPTQSKIITGGHNLEVVARKVDEKGNCEDDEIETVFIDCQNEKYEVLKCQTQQQN